MSAVRYIAALLLILTGILHALPFFKVPQEPNALPMLAFGIVYLTIGFLLIMNLKVAPVLGIIFPLLGLIAGFLMIGLENFTAMLIFLFAIDVIVIGCCTYLVFVKSG
jgi:uncharacterized membrane protein HdeD (DUF308 family)